MPADIEDPDDVHRFRSKVSAHLQTLHKAGLVERRVFTSRHGKKHIKRSMWSLAGCSLETKLGRSLDVLKSEGVDVPAIIISALRGVGFTDSGVTKFIERVERGHDEPATPNS